MDIPFNLTFYTFRGNYQNAKRFAESHKELIEASESYTIEVKENQDLEVLFETNPETRFEWTLEIDILDGLPESCFTYEELQKMNKPFFYPSEKKRPLYLDSRSDKNASILGVRYPMLIPGSYKIIIKNNNTTYFAFLKVTPLRIDNDQLDLMRKEIESYIKGLSLDFKRNSNMNLEKSDKKGSFLYKINLFIENYSRIISALNKITNNPKYLIKRRYNIKQISKSGRIDTQTIRFKQKRMDMHDKLLTYKNTIDYNVKENQMIKYIIYSLRKDVNSCLRFIREKVKRDRIDIEEKIKYLNRTEKEVMSSSLLNTLDYNDQVHRKLNFISNHCSKFITAEWLDFIEDVKYIKQPRLLASSQNYNVIYKLYLQVNSRMNIESDPLKNYNYYWKESSKLYEVWGFLKLKEAIEESDFDLKPVDGWIYDEKLDLNADEVPFLDPNTQIVFENDKKLKLVLYYDSIILREEETILENPVYTVEANNRPDIRIDIYISNIYIKSIIGDFKYRTYDSLSNVNRYMQNRTGDYTAVYRQLLAYRNIRTMYIGSKKKKRRSEEAAYEAWVFYPEDTDTQINRENYFDSSTNIRRIELSPKKDENMASMVSIVRDTIESIIEDDYK